MTDRRQFLRDSALMSALTLAGSSLMRVASPLAQRGPEGQLAAMTISELAHRLKTGEVTSRQLIEEALAAIKDPRGEGARAFLMVHETEALAAADNADAQQRNGMKGGVLSGIPISIKDLFDEAGVVTLGGSKVLVGSPAAQTDSTVVQRLTKAGAIIIGRTNLTEFAYSGLGINPHYGTPKNTFDRATGRIPGGSTSGGAISVTDGMAAAAIGTDTGGSVRIPAALNGLVGFKPTARRIPMKGVFPLAPSLDSVGPIAKSVDDCLLLDMFMAEERTGVIALPGRVAGLRFAVPTTLVQDDLSPAVATAFAATLSRLSAAGAILVDLPMKELAQAAEVSPRGALASYEAYSVHRQLMKEHADQYDPRVMARIRRGESITAAQFKKLVELRKEFIRSINAAAGPYDAMLMPTVPDTAPTIAEVTKDDESYFRFNGRMLRNPSIVNLFDGCALTIPCHEPGTPPVGLTIAGIQNADRSVLTIGDAVERAVRRDKVIG
jgi:aspartyl-tRNA(Asn)/glutamyl-tRNA(Gln) amidotransferase subunit A